MGDEDGVHIRGLIPHSDRPDPRPDHAFVVGWSIERHHRTGLEGATAGLHQGCVHDAPFTMEASDRDVRWIAETCAF